MTGCEWLNITITIFNTKSFWILRFFSSLLITTYHFSYYEFMYTNECLHRVSLSNDHIVKKNVYLDPCITQLGLELVEHASLIFTHL